MYEPFFHVGILVRDVEAARADFTARLGLEFEPVHSQQIATGETTRFCYSLQGPPYLELVEMTGTGSWSPDQPEGFHHLGLSDPSVPDRCTAFGGRVDLISPASDGTPLVILTHARGAARRPRRVLRRGRRGPVPRVPRQPHRQLLVTEHKGPA